MTVEKKPAAADSGPAPGRKRPYSAPRLTEYGSVAKLTQGTLTNQADGLPATSWKMACL